MIKLSACLVCGALSLYLAVSAGTTAFAELVASVQRALEGCPV
jgi:hypothetical protein